MSHKPQAVLAGYVLGLTCIGIGLPSLVDLIGEVVGVVVPGFGLPVNPGEAGYLAVFLEWVPEFIMDVFARIFSLGWFVPNAAKIALLVLGILLLAARPHWLIRLIGRCIT